jgi:hypothetical protein
MGKKIVKVSIELEVPFHSYGTKAKDRKALAQIVRTCSDLLRTEWGFFPLMIEKEVGPNSKSNGMYIEDATGVIKIRKVKGKFK